MTKEEFQGFLNIRARARKKRRQERILKALRCALNILAVAGAIVIMGSVGGSEYADICGEYRPVTHLVKWCAVGAAMIMPAAAVRIWR